MKLSSVLEFRQKNCDTLLDVSVSSLRRGHANLLCIVPILADDPRRGPTLLRVTQAYIRATKGGALKWMGTL